MPRKRIYRFLVELRVLPSLQRWCGREGIVFTQTLPDRLADLRAG